MPINLSVRFRQSNDLACEAGCEASDEVYDTITPGFARQRGTHIFVDGWLSGKIIHGELSLPVVGEIIGGKVMVELDKATFASDAEVTVSTAAGKQVRGRSIATSAISLRMPIEAVIETAEKKVPVGGMLILAEGSYTKKQGIVITKGTNAVILVQSRALTGNTFEEIRIAPNKFEMSSAPTGRTRKTVQPMTRPTAVDKWSSARIMSRGFALPVGGEIIEGNVLVELDKASFRPNTDVSAIVAGGKHVRGTTVSTAAIGFRVPIEAVFEFTRAGKKTNMGGLLLSAEGSYRKDQGIVIPAGTNATIVAGVKALRGKTPEEIRIGTNNLRMRSDIRGFRRITQ